MGKCSACGIGRATGHCANCNISVHEGDAVKGKELWCYFTPETHWGDVVWCDLCALAQDNGKLIEGVRPDNEDGSYVPRCKQCRKPLKDALSIERGYGPDCWSDVE